MAASAALAQLQARWCSVGSARAEAPICAAEALGALSLAEGLHFTTDTGAAAAETTLVTASSGSEAALERVATAAISLAFLLDFYDTCVATLADGAALTTKEVVTNIIMPATQDLRCSFVQLVPAAVAKPTAFASHAFGNPFSLLVAALREHFVNAVAAEVSVWVDIFAINQHDPSADLHGGRALARTIELASATLVVLDRSALPMSRLWCLYEIGSTPPDKLLLLTHGFSESDVAAVFRGVDVEAADCYDSNDKSHIREHIVVLRGSLAAFQQMLRLRLLLKPMSYEADSRALLRRSRDDIWRVGDLSKFVSSTANAEARLACITGGPGEGKSSIAAALCSASPLLVHAHHFCKASDVRRQDAGAVMRSLAYQLALCFPVFAGQLLSLSEAEAETLSDPQRAWDLLIKQPLSKLENTRVVLLVDALDEANEGSRSAVSKVLDLVLDLGRLQPDAAALSIIVTMRPEDGIIAPLRSCYRSFKDFAPSALRADGNAQSKLLRLLRSCMPSAAAGSVDEAYAAFFTGATGDAAPVARLLSVLMAARQPPSMAQLESLGVRSACASLPGWGLLFEEREHCLHVLHKSLREWLTGAARSGQFAADVTAGHAVWATNLSAQIHPWLQPAPGCAPAAAPPKGSYAYAHVLSHLDSTGRGDEARLLLLRLPWLQATLRERGVYALLADVAARMKRGGDPLWLLYRALRLSAPGLQGADAAEALPAQLVGRLCEVVDTAAPEMARLFNEAHAWRGELAWLRPNRASLRQPVGALEMSMEGHTLAVGSLVALGNGRLVSGSWDQSLRVWNAVTGECERTLYAHKGSVRSLAVLSDERVVSGSGDCTLRVWNATTGECERTLEGHTNAVTLLVVLCCSCVVSGSDDGTLRVWNAATGTCERIIDAGRDSVLLLAPLDNLRVAIGSFDKKVRIWNVTTGKCEHTMEGHTGVITSLLALDKGRLASGSEDNEVRLWNTATGQCVRTMEGHTSSVKSLVRMGAGRLISGSSDGSLRVWNTDTGGCVRTLVGHTDEVKLLLAVDDTRVVSGSRDKTLRIWNTATGVCERTMEGHTERVLSLVSLGNGCVATGSEDRTLRVWNFDTGEREPTLTGDANVVTGLAVLDDGRVVSRSRDKRLQVWNGTTGDFERTLEGHAWRVSSLVALDNGRVVSGSGDKTLRVWNAATGVCERTMTGHTWRVSSLVALGAGRVVSGSDDKMLRVWNAATGRCERAMTGHTLPVSSLVTLGAWRVVSGSIDKTLRVWNADTGVCERTLDGHASSVVMLVALDDERVVSSESKDGTLRVWNAAAGVCERTIEGHVSSLVLLVALGNGRVLSAGSSDKSLRLWNALTGVCERVVGSGSAAAAALLHCIDGVPEGRVHGGGNCVVQPGAARTYADAPVQCIARKAGLNNEPTLVWAAAGSRVHLFTVMPPAS